jgi:hypothetical protein
MQRGVIHWCAIVVSGWLAVSAQAMAGPSALGDAKMLYTLCADAKEVLSSDD